MTKTIEQILEELSMEDILHYLSTKKPAYNIKKPLEKQSIAELICTEEALRKHKEGRYNN